MRFRKSKTEVLEKVWAKPPVGSTALVPTVVVADAEGRVWPDQDFARVFQAWQQGEGFAHLHFEVFGRVLVDEVDGLLHTSGQHDAARSLGRFKAGLDELAPPCW